MRTVDADELLKSVRESAKRAEEWLADCKAYHSAMTARAEQAILTFNECALRIKNAPTVDAVPVVHGRWIDETFKAWGLVHHPYKCDQCGYHSEAPSDYCPDCGAKMDGKYGDRDEP